MSSCPCPATASRRFASLALALLLVGCQAPRPQAQPQAARPRVLASFTVLADMAAQVACGRLQVDSVTRPGAEIHGYEVTPADLRRARGAKLLLENGLGLERWMERFAASLGPIPRVTVSQGVATIPIAGDPRGAPNPHAWMSPRSARVYVENIRNAFIRLDPAGAATYRRCADAYLAQLARLDGDLRRSARHL